MPSLLLVVFILQLALHIINTVGVNTINELVCFLSGLEKRHLLMVYAAMDSLQQIPHSHVQVGSKGTDPEEGNR